jgi:hypothetical protein
MRRTAFTTLAALIGLVIIASPAHATPLPPGTSVVPDVVANPLTTAGNTILASIINSTATSTAPNGVTMSITYSAWVVRVGAGGAPISTGTQSAGQLDFVYQVTNNSSSTIPPGTIIASTSRSDFSNVGVGASYFLSDGQIAPVSANRSAPVGSVIQYVFPAAGIQPGQTSPLDVIQTNAVNFTTGSYTMQDGVTITVAAFQPAPVAGVPEPSSMVLVALGATGMVGYGLRRRKALTA